MVKENRFQFFEFNGKYYGPGTIVKFKSEFYSPIKKQKMFYGRYYTGCSYEGWHFFRLRNSPNGQDDVCVSADKYKGIYDIIEEIIVPVEVPYVSFSERKPAVNDWEDGDLIIWWIIYILFMIFAAIFVFPINLVLWAVASFVFWGCRYEKLKEHGYK